MERLEKKFRFPNSSQRTTIVGRTGSGKTYFGAWLLSHQNFETMPWTMFDFKGDDLLSSIPYVKPWSITQPPPREAGLYSVSPHPSQKEEVEDYLSQVWENENHGLYCDEGYMIEKDNDAFNAILTQGRSKNIPVICLTQRPAWVSRFVFSEADYFAVFHLNDKRDQKTVEYFFPTSIEERLDDYHSRWYDVGQDKIFHVSPVPNDNSMRERFEQKLKPKEGAEKKLRLFI